MTRTLIITRGVSFFIEIILDTRYIISHYNKNNKMQDIVSHNKEFSSLEICTLVII